MKINHYDNRIEVENVEIQLTPDIYVTYTVCFPLKRESIDYHGSRGMNTHTETQPDFDSPTVFSTSSIRIGNKDSQTAAIELARMAILEN